MATDRKIELVALRMGMSPALEVTSEHLAHLLRAYSHLNNMSSVEDKWDVLVENYRELELEWLRVALDSSLFSTFDTPAFMAVNRLLGRRLVNLLCSCRLYLDHVRGALKRVPPESRSAVLEFIQNTRSDNPDFRLMEELRNCLQHREIPIGTRHGSRRADQGEHPRFVFSTASNLIVDAFLGDPRIPHEIRKRLEEESHTQKPLNQIIRRYVELLWHIHETFRNSTAVVTDDASACFENVVSLLGQADPKFSKASQKVFYVRYGDAPSPGGPRTELADTIMQNYRYLLQKNRTLANLPRRIVTGEADQ